MKKLDDIKNCAIVLFGGNGDLATRKLLPSLYFLDRDKYLPAGIRIIGAARTEFTDDQYREFVRTSLENHVSAANLDVAVWQRFAGRLSYSTLDAKNSDDFTILTKKLALDEDCELVCYLATAPKLYGTICQGLQQAGLIKSNTRIVIEKPIGHDLASSKVINDTVATAFTETQIFRVDHYLGKETVQNILALRFANSLFEPLWNNTQIDHMQITVAETVGVEGRWSYYNESGAMRDMVQNHMLQLLALITMEPPSNLGPDAVRNEKVKMLRSLRPLTGQDAMQNSVYGQYTAGFADGKTVPGYTEEKGSSASETETFVALRAHIDNWRWAGVPFYLRTGKRLTERCSEIFIQFREVPHSIFKYRSSSLLSPNKLIIRLQPEENITLLMMNKVPGLQQAGLELEEVALNLSLNEAFQKERRRMAYERLFLDIILNDNTLFVRRDEIEAAWTWADGIMQSWQNSHHSPKPYAAGSWGPTASLALPERHGHSWHE